MTARRIGAATFALVAAMGLVACGDDDDDGGGGEALTEAEFIARADEICAASEAEIDGAANEAFAEEPTPDALAEFFHETAMPALRGQIEDIRALDGPDDFEAEVDELLDAVDAAIDDLEAMSDDELMAMAQSGEDPFADVNDDAVALGFAQCGGGDDE